MSEKRSILDSMKAQIKSSGRSFGNFFNIKESGGKVRVRFLTEMDDAIEMEFHSKWGGSSLLVYHPCLSYYGFDCPSCDREDIKTAPEFILQCWNYETKRVELFKFKANNCTPIFDLVNIYEEYGTITDMDIVITRNGTGRETSYTVMPKPATPFAYKKEAMKKLKSKSEVYAELLRSNNKFGEDPDDLIDVDEILDAIKEEEKPHKAKKKPVQQKSAPARRKRRKPEPEPEYDDYEDEYDDGEEEEEYEPPRRKKRAPAKKRPATKKRRPEPEYDEDEEEYDIDDFEYDDDDEDVPF